MPETLLEVNNLKTWYPIKKGLFQKTINHVKAVDGVSFTINKGETLSLVGESGCGKTTVGKTILRLIQNSGGQANYQGSDFFKLSSTETLKFRQKMQIIFQDPASSLNPKMLIRDIIAEGIRSFKILSENKIEGRVGELLEKVGLSSDVMMRYPHEFSGGQRQRICIARALAVEPEFIVCDEATSALDVSVQASILNLLKKLQRELNLTYLFITHDLSVVEYISDHVAVMYLGQIVEKAPVEQIFNSPKHPYTRALLKSAPKLNTEEREFSVLSGDVPSPINPPEGCRFQGRCSQAMDKCSEREIPVLGDELANYRCLL
jgi:oligopeptide/dipeptide ABC transporter ATP-binding protein